MDERPRSPRERDKYLHRPPIDLGRKLYRMAGNKEAYKELAAEMLSAMTRIMETTGAQSPTEALLMLGNPTPRTPQPTQEEVQLEILNETTDGFEGW